MWANDRKIVYVGSGRGGGVRGRRACGRPLHGAVREEHEGLLLRREEGAVVDGGSELVHGDDQLLRVHRLRADRVRGRPSGRHRVLVHRLRDPARHVRLRAPLAAGEPGDAGGIPGAPLRAGRATGPLVVRRRVPHSRQHGAALHPRRHRLAVPRCVARHRHHARRRSRARLHAHGRAVERARDGCHPVRGADGRDAHDPAALAERRRRSWRALRQGAGAFLPLQRASRHVLVPGRVLPHRLHKVQRQLVVRAAARVGAERAGRREDGPSLGGDLLHFPDPRRAAGRCRARVPAGPAAGAARAQLH